MQPKQIARERQNSKCKGPEIGASLVLVLLQPCWPPIVKTSFILSFKTYLGSRNTETTAAELTDKESRQICEQLVAI